MSRALPLGWGLLGNRVGDNHQVAALTEALGTQFTLKQLGYSRLWPILHRLVRQDTSLLDARSRATIRPPWPTHVVGIGRRSVAASLAIAQASDGQTKQIRLGNPRADPALFDLVITTRQYPVPSAPNVLLLDVPITAAGARGTPAETAVLDRYPRPHLLLLIGGPAQFWDIRVEDLLSAVEKIADRARQFGGSVFSVASPRTPDSLVAAVARTVNLMRNGRAFTAAELSYGAFLSDADECFVTADSASMIADAVHTGVPVGLVPVAMSEEGRRKLPVSGYSSTRRDMRRFWDHLLQRGLVGTVDEPESGTIEPSIVTAVNAVRELMP